MRRREHEVRDIHFQNPRLAALGVEVIALQQVRRWLGAAAAPAERPDFLLLLFVRGGRGSHRVDFVEHRLVRGDVVLVHPGQVQQWCLSNTLEADLVLVSPGVLAPVTAPTPADMQMLSLDDWPVKLHLGSASFSDAAADVDRLKADIERFRGDALDAALIWHELIAFMLRLARELPRRRAASTGTQAEIYRLLVHEVEKSLDGRLSVRELAKRLGYSESTLSRACHAAAGHSAKDAVDQRIALEAKRLLVHSDASVAQIASKLGFSESTNFVKFFRRLAGTSPMAFRSVHAGSAGLRSARAPPGGARAR